jgi:hypothetical protein
MRQEMTDDDDGWATTAPVGSDPPKAEAHSERSTWLATWGSGRGDQPARSPDGHKPRVSWGGWFGTARPADRE